MLRCVDYYLAVERVGKGYEDFGGSLRVRKEGEVGAVRSVMRGESLWGIKVGRR